MVCIERLQIAPWVCAIIKCRRGRRLIPALCSESPVSVTNKNREMPTNKLLISNFRALLGFLGEGSCFRSGLILHNGGFCVRKTQKVEPVALERYI